MTTPAAVLMAVGLVASEFPTTAPIPASKPKADGLIVVNCGDHLRLLNEAGREIKRYTPPKADGWPAWQIGPVSPDLKRLILTARIEFGTRYTRTVIAPLDGKGRLRPIHPPGGQFSDPFWAADGKRLIDGRLIHNGAFGVGSHCVNLTFEADTERVDLMPLPAIKGGPPEGGVGQFGLTDPTTYRRSLHRVIACSPAGDWYLTWQQKREGYGIPSWLALVSKDGRTIRRVLTTDQFAHGKFSPNGKRAVLTIWSRSQPSRELKQFDGVFVLSVNDNVLERVVAPPSDLFRIGWVSAAWSPDGKRIAFGYHRYNDDGFEFRVVSYTPDGGDPHTVLSVTGSKDEVAPLHLEGWH
ncbi:MAG TPA: hypothetical protein VFG68_22175 [Fimbriiglobus sp.]|nr:hypothetical protein [Fimbriiglobus sp.]